MKHTGSREPTHQQTRTMTRKLAPLALVFLLGLPALRAQEETPLIPIGSLSAFPTIVQTGTKPQLTWDITLPETVDDIVDIEPPGTVRPKRCLIMDVRVLGASVKRVWLRNGQVVDWEWTGSGLGVDWEWTGSGLGVGSYTSPDQIQRK